MTELTSRSSSLPIEALPIPQLRCKRAAGQCETLLFKKRNCARKNEGCRNIFVPGLCGLYGIPFDNRLPFFCQNLNGSLKQLRRNSLFSVTARYVKAGHTSHFVCIEALQGARTIEPREISSLTEGAPADWLVLTVGNQPSHGAILDHRPQSLLGRWSFEVLPFLSRLDPPPHTPTAAAGAFLSEKLLQVLP